MDDFLILLTRCKDEPFIQEFVTHYLSEGVDRIYIIDDGSQLSYPPQVLKNKKVTIYWEKDIIRRKTASRIYQEIRFTTKWMIYVDVDEYITTRKRYFKTIRQVLETTFNETDCVKIPWVMMSSNNRNENPKYLLNDNVHRWNHDNRHDENSCGIHKFRCRYDAIEVKSIFKPAKFDVLWDHHPRGENTQIKCVESVHRQESKLTPYYYGLREVDILNAYLVCYHYRVISRENASSKIDNNVWYQEYTVDDLMSTDYPELIDTTLKTKTRLRKLRSWLTF